MNFLFDTNIIIAFLKNDINIVNKIKNFLIINLSVITVGELLYGAKNSSNPKKNLKIYYEFLELCNLINISPKTSELYSDIRFKLKRAGKPIPENDIWIAASAKECNFTIVTRDKHLLNVDFIKTEKW